MTCQDQCFVNTPLCGVLWGLLTRLELSCRIRAFMGQKAESSASERTPLPPVGKQVTTKSH